MTIDIERLRNDIMNYYGTAMAGGFNFAMVDLIKAQTCSDEELIYIARKLNFDLTLYQSNNRRR